jgi:hypothetical protein
MCVSGDFFSVVCLSKNKFVIVWFIVSHSNLLLGLSILCAVYLITIDVSGVRRKIYFCQGELRGSR